ncbi:MAG: PAS domain S-box protein [Polyangiaceae bacterium]
MSAIDDARMDKVDSAESEERYRAIFELCPLAACVYELSTLRLLAVNEAMVRQYGYEREELLELSLLDILAASDREIARDFVEDIRAGRVQGPSRHDRLWRHRRKDGVEIDVDMIGTPLVYGGRPARLVLQQDVTERMRAAQELAAASEAWRRSESHKSAILNNMLDGLVTLDAAGIIESVNKAAETIFGFPAAQLIHRPFAALFAGPELTKDALFTRALGCVTEWSGVHRDGHVFPFELSLFRLESLRGSGFAAVVRDVSERYEVERLKSEFVSIVSHELRTPLTAMRGSIGLLVGGVLGELSDDVMEMLGIAERNTIRLIAIVNDILHLERLQRGHPDIHFTTVVTSDIVRRAVESVKGLADEQRVRIEVTSCDEDLRGDADKLVQVLVNLLSNAIKFSPREGRVQVIAHAEPHAVLFSVEDQGRGVPDTHRHLIFERFHQVQAADSREKGGTGLGLPISKAIIEQHGGSMGVESELGVGSTFWFRVPRSA